MEDPGREKKHSLLKAAKADKDYDHSLELLDEILATTPDAIDARITQTHLRALKGTIGLAAYRDIIAAIMTRLQEAPVPSLPAGRKILRGIQYSCSGAIRVQFIEALLASNRLAINDATEYPLDHYILQANIYLALGDYDRFLNTVENLSGAKRSPKKLRQLKNIATKCKSSAFPNYDADKVFGIGLSRTATSSLNLALIELGYDSIHWLNPNTQTVISDQDFFLFDGFTDIPVSCQFEKLYSTFPNSRFIYTNRSRDSWISSVSSHYKNARGISSPTQLNQPDIAQRFSGAAQPAERNLYSQFETWDDAFDHFQNRVNQFFSNKNGERFLELGITQGEGWEKLCTFLGKDVPDTPFPNVNQRPGQSKNTRASF